MTEDFYNLIDILLVIADESAAKSLGYKGKPYNYFEELLGLISNIKKQDNK